MSSVTRICPSQAGEPPMPMVGIATASVIAARHRLSAVPSMTTAKAPAVGHRMRVAQDLALGLGVAGRASGSRRRRYRLRRQPDMAHHRNAARTRKPDRLGHFLAAFELDRWRSRSRPCTRAAAAERLLRALLVAAERQVDDDSAHAAVPRTTAAPCATIMSSVTGKVLSKP